MKVYAPSAAPSAIAANSITDLCGSEKVALLLPIRSRAAAPAARLKFSGSNADLISPKPVNTTNFVFLPGNLITSSAFPVAPIAFNVASNEALSI